MTKIVIINNTILLAVYCIYMYNVINVQLYVCGGKQMKDEEFVKGLTFLAASKVLACAGLIRGDVWKISNFSTSQL